MYWTVPITAPVTVCPPSTSTLLRLAPRSMPRRAGPPVERAMPKSMIIASPSVSTMMLAGFRSRWTTPAACAAASPDIIDRAMRRVVSTGSFPSRLRMEARSSPSM